ncbi:MAG: ABC-2 type transport system ATP-binding protein [Kiritimatiellia bacterium]|jgi:ABC-2 type transport system ATP-binding protein
MIQLEGLNKSFGALHAVKDLNLEVPAGELFCFLGCNGAGKTTTIKMMTGLVRPDAGRIMLDGINAIADPVPAKSIMGYIPDMPFLYDRLTVSEFAQFSADLYRMPRAESQKDIGTYLEIFGLTDKRSTLIKDLSHGMRQRVIYASTLLHRPKILLVDEPFIGLDPHSIRMLKDLLRARTREEGMTIFMTTHILAIAEEIADRIGIIDHGKLIACGTMDELREREAHTGALEDLFLQLTMT